MWWIKRIVYEQLKIILHSPPKFQTFKNMVLLIFLIFNIYSVFPVLEEYLEVLLELYSHVLPSLIYRLQSHPAISSFFMLWGLHYWGLQKMSKSECPSLTIIVCTAWILLVLRHRLKHNHHIYLIPSSVDKMESLNSLIVLWEFFGLIWIHSSSILFPYHYFSFWICLLLWFPRVIKFWKIMAVYFSQWLLKHIIAIYQSLLKA